MLKVEKRYPLQKKNTLCLLSTAGHYTEVKTLDEIQQAKAYATAQNLKILPLGDGSNVVLGDLENFLVVNVVPTGVEILEENDNEILIRVKAGENWHQLVIDTVSNGWFGLENLALIPGQVGAAPVQNIGAYGVEVASFVETVFYISINHGDQSTTELRLNNRDCSFGYRDSIFKRGLLDRALITTIDMRLSKVASPVIHYPALRQYLNTNSKIGLESVTPKQVLDAVMAIRTAKLPDVKRIPNAGSFFKNPMVNAEQRDQLKARYPTIPIFKLSDDVPLQHNKYKLAAAWLIEQVGFKGKQYNGVGMNSRHALVLTNTGANTSITEVLAFADQVQRAVNDKFGVWLTIEPRVIT